MIAGHPMRVPRVLLTLLVSVSFDEEKIESDVCTEFAELSLMAVLMLLDLSVARMRYVSRNRNVSFVPSACSIV